MENTPVVKAEINTAIAPSGGLMPTSFEGLYRLSQIMSASKLMPKGIDTPEAVFVAVQMGMEVGLSPMQAVQNIAVINGRPSIWGDSVLALVRSSGLLEDFHEELKGEGEKTVAICTAKRKGQSKPIQRRFSVIDARAAELWGKQGPWKQYPARMLQMRARSWVLRDGFGDIIKGLKTAEEVMDYDMDMSQASNGSYIPAPVQDTPGPESFDTSEFDRLASTKIDYPSNATLDRFLEETAKAHDVSANEVKMQATERFEDFWQAFEIWQKKSQPKKETPEKPKEDPEKSIMAELMTELNAIPEKIRQKAAEKLKCSTSPITLDGKQQLLDECNAMMGKEK